MVYLDMVRVVVIEGKASHKTPVGSTSLVPINLDMLAYTLEEHTFSFDLKLTKREVTVIATLKTIERIFFFFFF